MRKYLRRLLSVLLLLIATVSPVLGGDGSPHGDVFSEDDEDVCLTCHTIEAWVPLVSPLRFDHDATGFPLTAAHADPSCRSCHESLVFTFVGTACADCHRDAHAGELGFRCEGCHNPQGWENQRAFADIHNRTLFALLAPHAVLECQACHSERNPWSYAATPMECDACHIEDFRAAKNPDHVASDFSTQCLDCHSPVASRWDEAVFAHPATFPLRGGHRAADCEDCHADGFVGTPTECNSCHAEDYRRADDPDHVAAGFPTECEVCHSDDSWDGARFDHNLTAFPLRGSHAMTDCESCHADGFTGTPTDCFSCHRTDYRQAKDPDHIAAGFPTQCQNCHGENSWEGATDFDHNQTAFPLRGSHRPLDCESCHSDGFAGTPTNCISCHRSDYNQTKDPDHIAAGFPTQCQTCHNETMWDGAEFNHNQTAFPLRDSHDGLDCQSCHAGGFAGTPTDCYSCHADDYNRANDPDHLAAGFPTTCETCHEATRWEDSNWDHDALYFPIYSGEHRGEWNDCSDCHVAAATFTAFECIFCHEHRRSEMDDEHNDVGGYVYESRSCLRCHPDGRE